MSSSTNKGSVVNKYNINLLQPELLPDKVLLTLPRVVALWGLALLIMVGWVAATHYNQQSLHAELTVLQQENNTYSAQLDTFSAQLVARKVDSQLTDRLATIKLLMGVKQALHTKLTNPNITYVTGFAKAMDELAQMHHQDIRLQTININNENMTFAGLALTPEAVPAWLAGFEHSVLLSGKSFSHFKLSENKDNITEFMVSSKIKEAATHD